MQLSYMIPVAAVTCAYYRSFSDGCAAIPRTIFVHADCGSAAASGCSKMDYTKGCRGHGDSHGDSHRYGMGMGTVINPHRLMGRL